MFYLIKRLKGRKTETKQILDQWAGSPVLDRSISSHGAITKSSDDDDTSQRLMAMLEKQLFDDRVGGGGGGIGNEIEFAAAAAAAGTTSKSTAAGPSSPRHRKSAEREGCADCGTMPPASSSSKDTSETAASDTTSQLSSAHLVPAFSDDHRVSRQTGTHSSTSLMTLEHRRSESPMLGMRGDLDGAGGASEPIRGLKAFGSQGSINDSSSPRAEASTNSGGGGGTRSSSRRPGPFHTPPDVATFEQRSGQGRARAGGGAGGAGHGGGGSGGSGQGELGKFAGAPPSKGPSRGGPGATSSGAGGGAKGSGLIIHEYRFAFRIIFGRMRLRDGDCFVYVFSPQSWLFSFERDKPGQSLSRQRYKECL